MNLASRIATGVLTLAFALPAFSSDYYDSHSHYQYARVVSASPVTRLVEVSEPRRECWHEVVTHRDDDTNRLGLVIGGVLGGILGNEVGDGDEEEIAIVVGTILGAGIGREFADRDDRIYTTTERRCRTTYEHYTESRTIGYRVSYRYHGLEYVTRMDHYPGERLRVRVDITPVE